MPNRTAVRPEIQALRAVAVLSVVLYHLWPIRLPGGFVGVDIFFAISGFLITGHLLRELHTTGRIAVGAFWGRRIRRLLPASLLVLLVTGVAVLLFVPSAVWSQFSKAVLAAVFYGENWYLAANAVDYLAADNVATPVQHFWSLGVEEQFYVAWPLILLASTVLVVRRGRRVDESARRRQAMPPVLIALGVIFAVSLVISIVLTASDGPFAYFGTHARAWEFAAGGLVAALVPGELKVGAGVRIALSWLGWIGIAATLVLFTGETPFPSYTALLPVVATLLVIAAGAPRGAVSPTPVMALRPVQWLGDVSYSLYLWHWPLIVIVPYALTHPLTTVDKVVILVVSTLLAALTKRFVEDPFRRFRAASSARRRSVWTYATAVALMVVVSATPLAAIQHGRVVQAQNIAAANRLVKDGSACFGASSMVTSGCPATTDKALLPNPATVFDDTGNAFSCYRPAGQAALKTCTFGSTASNATKVAVVGDSHGAMLIPGLRDRAAKSKWNVTTYVGNGGAWRNPDTAAPGNDRDYLTSLDAALLAGHYDIIITTAHRLPAGNTAAARIEGGMTSVWATAQKAGITVIALADNPQITDEAHACEVSDTTFSAKAAQCGVSRESGLGGLDTVAVAAKSVDLPIVDMTKYYCTASRCPAVIGGVIVYRDDHHLTATYSRSIAPFLLKAIDDTAKSSGAGA